MPGFRQRINAEHADRSRSPLQAKSSDGDPAMGAQLRNWLTSWAWGKSSAAGVVENACAYLDEHGRKGVDERIVKLARTRQNPQNAERIVEQLLPLGDMCKPMRVDDSVIECVLPPYDFFHWLRVANPYKFRIHLGAKPGGLEHWWSRFLERPAAREYWSLHPWLMGKKPKDLAFHVPLMLFDDAGPISKHQSTFARVWYSLLGVGAEKETRFLMATGLKTDRADRSWGPIMASLERLAGPVEPGSWGGVPLFMGADLEYACNVMKLKHYSAVQMCMHCEADKKDIPFHDFHGGAKWRSTILSNDAFMARVGEPRNPMVAHVWFNKYTYRYDLLHMLDHHGVASHIVGNILHAHLSSERETDVLPGSNMQERLGFLNSDIQAFYTAHKVANRLPPLKETNVKDGHYPELKGNAVKAANTRALVPYVQILQQHAAELNNTTKQKCMKRLVDALQTAYDIMYQGDMVLDDDQVTQLRRSLTRLGQNYTQLHDMAAAEDKTRWDRVPKLHYVVAHLGEQAALINPRYVQGYASESMVGEICGIYEKSQSGRFHKIIQEVALLKYCTGMKLMWV